VTGRRKRGERQKWGQEYKMLAVLGRREESKGNEAVQELEAWAHGRGDDFGRESHWN
jgi:hypothetical protein